MRLERVALQGFLSHVDTDWQPDGARLVTLVGANGAGKSSLAVDGPLYALFDDARGRTDDLVRLGATEMSALVEFSYAGNRYRVERGRSTRSGGRSRLELAIADGEAWRPLTAESIRETQQRIEELLRMDAATFETAVVLVQGESMRFAEATPAERKRILGTVLGLDLWERAEARAKEAARDLDGRCAGERAHAERLRLAIDALADAEAAVGLAQETLAALDAQRARADELRTEAGGRLRALAGQVVAAEAAQADVRRLEAELEQQKGRWRLAEQRRRDAEAARDRAMALVARADEVAAAVVRAATLRSAVAAAERVEQAVRGREDELRGWEERLRRAEREDAEKMAHWREGRRGLVTRVETLTASIEALRPVQCGKCGNTFPADPAGLRVDLVAAEMALKAYGPEPVESLELQKARGQAELVRSKIRDLGFDAAALAALRRDLSEAERTAALADSVTEAGRSLQVAEDAIAAAGRELDAITGEGRTARTALEQARERAGEVAGLLEQRRSWETTEAQARAALRELDGERATAQSALATAQARVAERDRAATELLGVGAALSLADTELARLRRLAEAFGVKGIPARIIASVLPELEGYANELLGSLRPGMSLAVRAQRARKGGDGVTEALDLVVRDDAGERPLALFSGGERMSVSLAIAVALSRLVARRAGTAIRTLVVDEPDGLDAEARRSFGQALRVLAHHGELERVVLVSHHPDLADVGDAVYQVTKDGRGSVVEQIA